MLMTHKNKADLELRQTVYESGQDSHGTLWRYRSSLIKFTSELFGGLDQAGGRSE